MLVKWAWQPALSCTFPTLENFTNLSMQLFLEYPSYPIYKVSSKSWKFAWWPFQHLGKIWPCTAPAWATCTCSTGDHCVLHIIYEHVINFLNLTWGAACMMVPIYLWEGQVTIRRANRRSLRIEIQEPVAFWIKLIGALCGLFKGCLLCMLRHQVRPFQVPKHYFCGVI